MLTTIHQVLCVPPPKKTPTHTHTNNYHHPFSSPNTCQTHSLLLILPRLFARGGLSFLSFFFYLSIHSMTPVPPVSCCLTPPFPQNTHSHTHTHTHTHSFSSFLSAPTYPLLSCSFAKPLFSSSFFPFLVCVSKNIHDWLVILCFCFLLLL